MGFLIFLILQIFHLKNKILIMKRMNSKYSFTDSKKHLLFYKIFYCLIIIFFQNQNLPLRQNIVLLMLKNIAFSVNFC